MVIGNIRRSNFYHYARVTSSFSCVQVRIKIPKLLNKINCNHHQWLKAYKSPVMRWLTDMVLSGHVYRVMDINMEVHWDGICRLYGTCNLESFCDWICNKNLNKQQFKTVLLVIGCAELNSKPQNTGMHVALLIRVHCCFLMYISTLINVTKTFSTVLKLFHTKIWCKGCKKNKLVTRELVITTKVPEKKYILCGLSKNKPNLLKRVQMSQHRWLTTVAPCSSDLKL
jgi:hypothetical protein